MDKRSFLIFQTWYLYHVSICRSYLLRSDLTEDQKKDAFDFYIHHELDINPDLSEEQRIDLLNKVHLIYDNNNDGN